MCVYELWMSIIICLNVLYSLNKKSCSFLHHFYPAYDSTIADYAAKVTKKQQAVRETSQKKAKQPRGGGSWKKHQQMQANDMKKG